MTQFRYTKQDRVVTKTERTEEMFYWVLARSLDNRKLSREKSRKKSRQKRRETLGESRDKNQKTQKNNVVKNYKIKTQRRMEKVDKSD